MIQITHICFCFTIKGSQEDDSLQNVVKKLKSHWVRGIRSRVLYEKIAGYWATFSLNGIPLVTMKEEVKPDPVDSWWMLLNVWSVRYLLLKTARWWWITLYILLRTRAGKSVKITELPQSRKSVRKNSCWRLKPSSKYSFIYQEIIRRMYCLHCPFFFVYRAVDTVIEKFWRFG